MLAKLRSRLTYANVMATVAVFMALGGGAYAAVKLPANSVGSKQIRKKAVTPAKVNPATVKLFKGQSGAAGPKGDPGQAGSQGPIGPRGPSDTYIGSPLSSYTTPSSMSVVVPAGDYVATAKVVVQNAFNQANPGAVQCDLTSPDSANNDRSFTTAPNKGAAASPSLVEGFATVVNHTGFHLSSGGTITETCATTGDTQQTGLGFQFGKLSATRVGLLHP